jgi:hypothetical protein
MKKIVLQKLETPQLVKNFHAGFRNTNVQIIMEPKVLHNFELPECTPCREINFNYIPPISSRSSK